MRLTAHAEIRSQQRAIPPALIEVIRAYGSPTPARRGSTRYMLDRHSIALACEGDRRLSARLERHRGTWLVAGPDDQVVTVGHQTLRFFN
ncbi:hypothetical protein [Frigidibacter sp. MR17.24]|uniref:hypothetical protein n=1 Tax=Frigidibacter sp. MR17.24 TaxID=3127345 RepID=UPI003012A169